MGLLERLNSGSNKGCTVQWEKRERLLDLMESAKRGKNVTCGQKTDRSLEFNRENSRCKNFVYKLCKFRIMPALSFIPYINPVSYTHLTLPTKA